MITKINTEKAPAAIGPYAQAVILDDFLFASGQLPVNPSTGAIAGSTIKEQSEQVMKNIQGILEEANMSFDNVVKTTCYLSDMQDFAVFNEVYATYFTSCPARSCIAVKEIPKNVLCEIEFIAHK